MAELTRPVFLLTDFGMRDTYAGQMRAVIAAGAPGSAIHDLSHDVQPFDVEEGAWMLQACITSLPDDAVVLAVVDPGVGGTRRGIVVSSGGRDFVGPDNGLLSGVFPDAVRHEHTEPIAPGIGVHELAPGSAWRRPVSQTFHGRDIFAPVAAWLAVGNPAAECGPSILDPVLLPPFGGQRTGDGSLQGRVIHIDHFGNLITTIRSEQIVAGERLEAPGHGWIRGRDTFSDVAPGEALWHRDSSGYVAIAMNQRNAAVELGLRRGDIVRMRPG